MRRGLAAVAGALLPLLPAVDAMAQPTGMTGGNGGPIEIHADEGIEWQQRDLVVKARGNARAIRGDVEVRADELQARYRETPEGTTEIWRIEAEGNVEIESPSEIAYAEKGTYDVDESVLVLSGGDRVRLVSADGTISAKRQLEYWETKRILVARGDAMAEQPDRTLKAETLVAHFVPDGTGELRIERVEAFDRVEVTTAEERVQADRGVYKVKSGLATLTGSVRLTRGDNQLNGCSAEVDTNTGVSKLFGCDGAGGGTGRVRGLIRPERRPESNP